MARYLLIRPDDHLVLGCDFPGCVLTPGSGTSSATVSAPASGPAGSARLVVTFPPQHVAEQVQDASSSAVPAAGFWPTALAGSSRLVVALPPGSSVPLTVPGLLTALGQFPVVSDAAGTAIEAPWRLVTAPHPPAGGGILQAVHRPAPLASNGVTGLWHTSIVSPRDPSALLLVPADAGAAAAADPAFRISLGRNDRMRLAAEAASQPITADRLGLSPLGAWTHAWGNWPSFSWNHELHAGRDVRIRLATQGTLYPTGHRATFVEYVERTVGTPLGGIAVLRGVQTIFADAPLAAAPADEAVARRFPFDGVELLDTRVEAELGTGPGQGWQQAGQVKFFWPLVPGSQTPASPDGQRVQFAVRLPAAGQAPVTVRLPLMFVADPPSPAAAAGPPPDAAPVEAVEPVESVALRPEAVLAVPPLPALPADAQTLAQLVTQYGQQRCDIASQMVDLIRAQVPAPGDLHEVHSLMIAANNATAAVAPVLSSVQVAIPALRGLLGADPVSTVRYTADYLAKGAAADVILSLQTQVGIDFTKVSNLSGGLVAPKYLNDALSRTAGPVASQALQALATGGTIDPGALFPAEATLLGFALRDLVTELKLPPQIVPGVDGQGRPTATMTWKDVPLKSSGCFVASAASRLSMTAAVSAGGTDISCSVTKVGLRMPPGSDALLTLTFDSISFRQRDAKLPAVSIDGIKAKFTGDLSLLQELENAVDLSALSPYFDISPVGIVAHYSVPLPEIAAGPFVLRDAIFSTRLEVPFDGRPVELRLAFASMANPFDLTVLMFGGGGYVEMAMTHQGLTHFDIGLEFGAMMGIDFGVVSAEVHAFGGVRFSLSDDGSVSLTGYIRIGGSVDILGLVSVSVEMSIQLSYDSGSNALVGRATLVIDVDLGLWSEPFMLDTGPWVLAGHAPQPHAASAAGFAPHAVAAAQPADDGLARWRRYRTRFAGLPSAAAP